MGAMRLIFLKYKTSNIHPFFDIAGKIKQDE
jgi:hypothetical protein